MNCSFTALTGYFFGASQFTALPSSLTTRNEMQREYIHTYMKDK
jgi:hypothetical protein